MCLFRPFVHMLFHYYAGAPGDLFYVVEEGVCEVVKNDDHLATFGQGRYGAESSFAAAPHSFTHGAFFPYPMVCFLVHLESLLCCTTAAEQLPFGHLLL
jgi:hypothetical protein